MKFCLESNNNLIKNQGPYNQTENDEIPGTEYDSKDRGTSKTSAILNLMSQIFPDDESINTLNSKQRKVFNVTYPSIM